MSSPNVIFILADDLGYGDIGAFGNDALRTPHLDRVMSEGVSLTQHYSGSPLCAPARAALLTGRYNHRTGAVDVPSNRGLDRIALHERTIADAFRAAGYATGLVGKWHNGLHDMRYHPNARGFDEFVGFLNGGMDYYRWVLDRDGEVERSDGRYLTDVFTQEATHFVRRHGSQPFFLYLSYNAPHSPLQAPESRIQQYREPGRFTEEVCRTYAMIEQLDAGIGQILEALDTLGLADNTIVVFTSDNGPVLAGAQARYNGPFRGAKGDAREGGIRVPAIVRWPHGLPAGLSVSHMIHFVDWLPTLLSLAGATWQGPLALDGYDVTCRLRGETGDVPDIRFWQRNRYEPVARCNGAMRDGPWKLVWPMIPGADTKEARDNIPYEQGLTAAHWLMDIDTSLPQRTLPAPGLPQLYDVEADPCEERDLAEQHPARVATMTAQWDAWFEEVLAEWHEARRRVVDTGLDTEEGTGRYVRG